MARRTLLRQIGISLKPDKTSWIGLAVKVRRYEAVVTAKEEWVPRNSIERGARCQVRSGVERTHLFMHTKS